jgi:hypothetical protein
MPLSPVVKTRYVRRFLRQYKDPYYDALGRFVTAFSMVETTLLRVLWKLAHLEAPYAQAVLSGVRIEGSMGYINRIADAEKWSPEKRQNWQKIFSQIGLINKLRNDILHYGTSEFGSVRVVTNVVVAHTPDRVREIHIKPAILDKASKDLWDIFLFLTFLGGIGEIYGKQPTVSRLRRKAWRYKQPPQADWAKKMNQNRPGRRRRPRSSRA